MRPLILAGVSLLAISAAHAEDVWVESPVSGKQCKVRYDEEHDSSDFSHRTCAAVGGYSLRIDVDDARDDAAVRPEGRKWQPLRISEIIDTSGTFAEIRGPALWLVRDQKPVALVLTLHSTAEAMKPGGRPLDRAHYLVAKIGPKSCLVADAQTLAKAKVRAATDAPCM